MRVAIEAILDYDFAEPTDVLLAVEAAALPDQRIVSQSHIINNAGPLTNKVGGSGVGRRTWTRTGTGRMLSTYRATVDVERPTIDLSATLGQGDAFDRVLERAGVGRADAAAAAALLAQATPLADLQPGTRIALTLGRRPQRDVPRPLDRLSLRARFDLNVAIDRGAGGLGMTRMPIAIDRTPLRIRGLVGGGLYRSARAAGARRARRRRARAREGSPRGAQEFDFSQRALSIVPPDRF